MFFLREQEKKREKVFLDWIRCNKFDFTFFLLRDSQ